jgi:hypothetical protein
VLPNVEQYTFDRMVELVGPGCASACEDEAYSFSQVPGMIVVGMFPTQGTMADVGDGQFSMPDGISMQFPTERFLLSDGSLFLQGTGVQPTMRVPITAENVLSTDDVVLQFGEQAALHPLGAGITPSGPPTFVSTAAGIQALNAKIFEQAAREQYTSAELAKVPNTFSYTIALSQSEPLDWSWGWCAKDQATLDENLTKMQVTFTLDGQAVPIDKFVVQSGASSGMQCKSYDLGLTDWPSGEHHAVTTTTFTAPVNDGTADYPAGVQESDYTIYVP